MFAYAEELSVLLKTALWAELKDEEE